MLTCKPRHHTDISISSFEAVLSSHWYYGASSYCTFSFLLFQQGFTLTVFVDSIICHGRSTASVTAIALCHPEKHFQPHTSHSCARLQEYLPNSTTMWIFFIKITSTSLFGQHWTCILHSRRFRILKRARIYRPILHLGSAIIQSRTKWYDRWTMLSHNLQWPIDVDHGQSASVPTCPEVS